MMDKSLCIWIKVVGSGYLLRFNDMVVASAPMVDSPVRLVPVHEFVLNGNNVLSVFPILQPSDLGCIGTPMRQRRLISRSVQIELKLMLVKDRGAGVLVEPQVLQGWSRTLEPSQVRPGACGLEVDIELPFTFPRWRWADLATGTVAFSRVESLVRDRIEQMCRLVESGDEEPFLRQFNVRVEEYAKAYNLELTEAASRFRKWLGLAEGRLKLADCSKELEQMQLISCRQESVVYPLNAKGEPFLQLQIKGTEYKLHLGMHLAVFGEQVYIVR